VTTTFAEDDLVIAEAPNVTVQRGDGGRVIESGTWEYHRVYWPRYQIVAYHHGNHLRRVGSVADV
jgi:hypothetical protein